MWIENVDRVATVIGLMKDRISFLHELWDVSDFFFVAPSTYDEKTVRKRWKETAAQNMTDLVEVFQEMTDFSSENQEKIVMAHIENNELKVGEVMNALRLAVVGASKGPHMFDITAFIGQKETVERIKKAVEVLG